MTMGVVTVKSGPGGVRYHPDHASSTGRRRHPRRAGAGSRIVTLLCAAVGGRRGAAPEGAGRGDLFDELFKQGQAKNGDLKTLTASFVETTTSTLLTRPLVSSGTLAVERPSRIVLRYTQPDERVVLIDGDTMTMSWPSKNVRQSKDIGAAQKRIQKYFVDSTPDELRSHFTITARRGDGSAGHLSGDDGAEAEADSGGAVAARAVGRSLDAADGGDEDDVPERRHQADDVHGRQAERAGRSRHSSSRRLRRRGAAAATDWSAAGQVVLGEVVRRVHHPLRAAAARASGTARCADRPGAATATRSCARAGSAPSAATSRSTARRSARGPSAGSHSRWCMSNCAQRRAAGVAASPRNRPCPAAASGS